MSNVVPLWREGRPPPKQAPVVHDVDLAARIRRGEIEGREIEDRSRFDGFKDWLHRIGFATWRYGTVRAHNGKDTE